MFENGQADNSIDGLHLWFLELEQMAFYQALSIHNAPFLWIGH